MLVRKLSFFLLVLFLVAGLAPLPAQAQGPQNTCPQIVRQAFTELATNCAGLGHDEACLGFAGVQAQLYDDPEHPVDEGFVEPGTRAELARFSSIMGSPMDTEAGTWGIAVLNVQADLPTGVTHTANDEKAVTFVLLGDVEVEDAVAAENLLLPVNPIAVTFVADATLVTEPGASEAHAQAAADETYQADGISPDGQWVRVANHGHGEWAPLDALKPFDTALLPVITEASRTPMQSFFLRNGYDASECRQAVPAMLLVQTQDDVEADLVVNGMPVRIGSTIILRVMPPGDRIKLQVVSGFATLYPGTPDEMVVPAGFSVSTCLADPDTLLGWNGQPDDRLRGDCPIEGPIAFTQAEQNELRLLEGLPENVVSDGIGLPPMVCASGVGAPICRITLPQPAYDKAIELCESGKIEARICDMLEGPR